MTGPYTLKIEGVEHEPESFGPLERLRDRQTIYNPSGLHRSALEAAERVAFEMVGRGESIEVEVIGSVAGKRVGCGYVRACGDYRDLPQARGGLVVHVYTPRWRGPRQITRKAA